MSEEIKPLFFEDLEEEKSTNKEGGKPSTSFENGGEGKDTFVSRERKPDEIINKNSNFIFFFGAGESGKSVILASMLYAMRKKFGVISPKIGTPNSKEARVLLETFFEDIGEGKLPERTDRDKVTRMDLVFNPNNKSQKVPPIDLTFLEASGENWNEIKRGGVLHKSLDTYLSSDIPLTFIITTGYSKAHEEDSFICQFLYMLEEKRYNLKRKTNVIMVVSKWDQSGSERIASAEELDNFMKERLPMTNNFLETYNLDKTYSTIGELYKEDGGDKERIRYLNLSSAERLSKWLYKSIAGKSLDYPGTMWEQLKWSIGLK
uniref:hypothetical protein n=1 Tax=Ornithobacterium rhinotracheale TaxID=28251 RepID=UPI001627B9B5|nr:hypothetical protein [Ornithobacterium rhinotracheale]